MCYVQIIAAVVAVVVSVAQNQAQNRQNRKIEKAINEQKVARDQEIDNAAGAEMNERARAVRRARAAARATASESGINLESGSFLAQLQGLNAQADIEAGLVTKNKEVRKNAAQAEYGSALSRISYKTGLGIAVDAVGAGVSAYTGAGGTFGAGALGGGTKAASTSPAIMNQSNHVASNYPGSRVA